MKNAIMMRSLRAGVLALMFVACDSQDALGPLVILTNLWRDAANANHTFDLNDNNNGSIAARSGTFTGTETLPAGTSFSLEGSWSDDGKIQFTVHRSPDVTYRGTLAGDSTKRIDFTSSAGALTLVRN